MKIVDNITLFAIDSIRISGILLIVASSWIEETYRKARKIK